MKANSALATSKKNLPREAKKTNDSTFDRIHKYFHSKSRVELTVEETDIMNRWEKAWLLMIRNRTANQTAQIIERTCKVSRATAFDDVRSAMMLFGDPRLNLKEAKRAIAEEAFLRGANKAWANNDLDLYHKFYKEYCALNGLFDAENSADAFAEFVKNYKPAQVLIVASKKDLEAEATRLQAELTMDVEHSEE